MNLLLKLTCAMQPKAKIGARCVITSANIGTECEIADDVHISGDSVVEGFVKIGAGSVLKPNSWVKEKQEIPAGTIVKGEPQPKGPKAF